MCFIQTLVITCTVSEILTQTDRKNQNRTFQSKKLHLEWFHSLHILAQHCHYPNKASSCSNSWAALRYYWSLYDNMAENVKKAKSDLSDLKKWPLERFNENQNSTGRQHKQCTGRFHDKLQGNSSRRFGEKHLWNFVIRANFKIGDILT